MRTVRPATTRERRRASGLRLFVVLACLALVGHLAQASHFASEAHVVGADGKLRHTEHEHGSCGHHHELPAPEPGEPDPDHPPCEGDPCPWLPPAVDPVAGPGPGHDFVACTVTPNDGSITGAGPGAAYVVASAGGLADSVLVSGVAVCPSRSSTCRLDGESSALR